MGRFERQVILPGFGNQGQQKLKESSVLVVGAGGLGCPALLYLAAAGVGKIGVVDGDVVSLSNLNRQILYGEKDLGKNKAEVASHYFLDKYSDISWEIFPEFISNDNAETILSSYDLILDGSDNFPTRYLVNDACVLLGKPLVFGAIYQHEGQVSVFNLGESSCNYRDLYPVMPSASEIPNCSETGVLGVLPGIIGNLMALEAIKVLTGFGEPLKNRVLFFSSLSSQSYEIELSPNPDSPDKIPKNLNEFRQMNYELACEGISQVNWDRAAELASDGATWVDVREYGEIPEFELGDFIEIPLSELDKRCSELKSSDELLLFCQSGIRSQKAALLLKNVFPEKRIFSVKGGINSLEKN
jgi:sulfur-carrier protein adenylyltransferase/sulfurtransferase